MEYRQKVNRIGLRWGGWGNLPGFMVVKYSIYIHQRKTCLSPFPSLSLPLPRPLWDQMTQCICKGQKCILSAWDRTILGSAVSAGMPAIALQPSNSDLSVLSLLHSPLLIFPHKKALWRHWKLCQRLQHMHTLGFTLWEDLAEDTCGLPHTYVQAHSCSSIFMDPSHCHTLSHLWANWASLGLGFSFFPFSVFFFFCTWGSMKATLSCCFSTFRSSFAHSAFNCEPVEEEGMIFAETHQPFYRLYHLSQIPGCREHRQKEKYTVNSR